MQVLGRFVTIFKDYVPPPSQDKSPLGKIQPPKNIFLFKTNKISPSPKLYYFLFEIKIKNEGLKFKPQHLIIDIK